MSKIKKNHLESITYKKVENFGAHFPFSGGFTTRKKKKIFRRIFPLPGIYSVKGNKKMKIFRRIFQFPGIYPMEGEKMKKIIFFETVFRFPGIYPMEGEKMKKFNFFWEDFPTSGGFTS